MSVLNSQVSESRSLRSLTDIRPTVCQVLHSLAIGGAEVLADRLARGLSDRYRFVFACLDEVGVLGKRLQDDGFSVRFLNRGTGIDLGCARRLALVTREEKVDLLHTHQYTPFVYGMMSRLFQRYRPILFTEHGRFHPDCPRRKRIWFNRCMIRRSDRMLGVGRDVRRALIENEGFPGHRTEIIYNGIDLARFRQDFHGRDSIRRECGISADAFVVTMVARLDPIKDHLTAIRTIEHVRSRIPDACLLIAGDGPEHSSIEMEIRRRNLQNAVRMLGMRRDIPELLGASDVVLLTSVSEGIPLTLIEGMAASLPVVATDVGGVREIVVPGETGVLAAACDDSSLAAAILLLASDQSLRKELGKSGRRRAEELFSEQRMHAEYEKLYREMVTK